MKTKEQLIESLVDDYEDYLSDFNQEALQLIYENGFFTFKDARQYIDNIDKLKNNLIN